MKKPDSIEPAELSNKNMFSIWGEDSVSLDPQNPCVGLASAHLKHLQWGRRTMGHRWIPGAHWPVNLGDSSDIQVQWDLSNYKVEKKTSKVNPLASIYVHKHRWVNLHICVHTCIHFLPHRKFQLKTQLKTAKLQWTKTANLNDTLLNDLFVFS